MSRSRLEIQSKEGLKTYNTNTKFVNYLNYRNYNVNTSYAYQVLKEYTNQNYIAINNYLREGYYQYHLPNMRFGDFKTTNNKDGTLTVSFAMRKDFLNATQRTLSNYWTYHKMIYSLCCALLDIININELDYIPENTVVYRGINTRIPSNWKVGDSFYFPGFISTSLSKKVAEDFGNYILVITLHGKGYKGVERISYYPNEKEVLICPYSRYVISKISGNYCYLDRYNN